MVYGLKIDMYTICSILTVELTGWIPNFRNFDFQLFVQCWCATEWHLCSVTEWHLTAQCCLIFYFPSQVKEREKAPRDEYKGHACENFLMPGRVGMSDNEPMINN